MLLPWLQSKITNSWVDPRKVTSDDDLLYEYKLAWAFAKASNEIIDFIIQADDTLTELLKKKRGEKKDKLRESVS